MSSVLEAQVIGPGRKALVSRQQLHEILDELAKHTSAGRQLVNSDRFHQLRRLVEAGGVRTLEFLLPIALSLNNKPYTLRNHFPFSPLFDVSLTPNILLKTGRQVSKTTSLAAHGVLLANCVPDFKTLYVTPLYEQIRRFSNNFVRPFIDRSPLRGCWTSTATENSVLQRTFRNYSSMIFSFALLDADRIRGVPADKIAIDESSCGITTYVETLHGPRLLKHQKPGDFVLSVTDALDYRWSRVLTSSYHGRRTCWRITVADGSYVDGTSESWVITTEGPKRVSQIIESAGAAAGARDAPRGRLQRLEHPDRQLPEQPWLVPARLQHLQVHDLVRVQWRRTQEEEEQRLRRLVKSLPGQLRTNVFLLQEPLLSAAARAALQHRSPAVPEGCPEEMVDRYRSSGALGGDRLVDRGRRQPAGHTAVADDDLQHAGVYAPRSAAPFSLVEAPQHRQYHGPCLEPGQDQDLLDHPLYDTGDLAADREYSSLCASADALQGYRLAGVRGGLFLLRTAVPASRYAAPRPATATAASVLPGEGVPACTASVHIAPFGRRSAPPAATAAADQGALLCRSASVTRTESRKAAPLPGCPSRLRQCAAAGAAGAQYPGRTLLPLSDSFGEDGARAHAEVLSCVPESSAQGDTAALRRQGPGLPGLRSGGRPAGAGCSGRTDMPAMRADVRTGQQCPEALHAALPHGCNQRSSAGSVPEDGLYGEDLSDLQSALPADQPKAEDVREGLCEAVTEQAPTGLQASEIVRIEYVGEHDVYDIHVDGNSVVLLNGLTGMNCQDMDPEHIPIIRECMSASDWGLAQFTGTPKSNDNPIEGLWKQSSMAEWFIRCHHAGCGEWNIPSLDYHINDMIGPVHEGISPSCPGVICHKCGKPLNPRAAPQGNGHWVHRYPGRRDLFVGYHVPQIILPMHYERVDKWRLLCAKRTGWGNTPLNVFYNEVLGESVDEGQKLVSETELQDAACLGWANNPERPDPEMLKRLPHYRLRVLGVDWGGGGEEGVSFTALALMGFTPTGKIDVLWGKRLLTPNDHIREAVEIRKWMMHFHCHLMAHDYTGAGIVRETVLVQAGMDIERLMPIQYVRAASKSLITPVPPTILHARQHYRLDKTRSLLYTCQAIKLGLMRFFKWDYETEENRGLLNDFLALVSEKTETRLAGDIYTITRNTMRTDDFAHACNLGAVAIWHAEKAWPNFAEAAGLARVTSAQIQAAGSREYGWNEDTEMRPFFNQP